MTSIGTGTTYMGSSGYGSDRTLVAGAESGPDPTKVVLYIYPDLESSATKKVVSLRNLRHGDVHRSTRHTTDVNLRSHLAFEADPSDTDTLAASRFRMPVEDARAVLLCRVQNAFNTAFAKKDWRDEHLMGCLEEATNEITRAGLGNSQANSQIFEIAAIVPCTKTAEQEWARIRRSGHEDVETMFTTN